MQDDPRQGAMSASNALADQACPGRWSAQEGLPETENSDALFGRRIHAALAIDDPAGLAYDELDIFHACKEVESKLLLDFFGDRAMDALKHTHREKRLWLTLAGHAYTGCPDVWFRLGSRILLTEYKALPGEIPESESNLQLRSQALLVWRNEPLINEIGVSICQPLVTRSSRICVYGPSDLEAAEQELTQIVKASHHPNAPRVAGHTQCKFCKAKPACEPYAMWLSSMIPVTVAPSSVPSVRWTPQEWAHFLDHKGAIRSWVEDREEEAKAMLAINPNAIPGYCLEPGNEVESLTNLDLIYTRFLALGGTHEQFMQCLSGIRIKSKLEDQLRKATGLSGKALKSKMASLTNGASVFNRNKPSLTKIKGLNVNQSA